MTDPQRTLAVRTLTKEGFAPFGSFASLTPPLSEPLVDDGTIAFWPHATVMNLGAHGNNQVAFGVCQVKWRPLTIDVAEYHTGTDEGILPLDGDVYIHVAEPTGDGSPPEDPEKFQVFRVPQGTMVVLKAGVWHHAPFATKEEAVVNTLITLPPRTFINDCLVEDGMAPISFELT
jgi:ureidoglycolate lyase